MNPALDLANFIDASPSPYHAVEEIARRLRKAGFQALDETEAWKLDAGDKRYVIRQGSSILAFVMGTGDPSFHIVGAHTDSPCLKLKPNFPLTKINYAQAGVEVYGGAIWATWLDRDLGVAGRVINKKGKHSLVKLDAVLRIPNLAIHLNRKVNDEGLKLNPQTQLVPVVGLGKTELLGKDVADFDLSLYDLQKATVTDDFIFAARLDNLASCHAGTTALLEHKKPSKHTRVLVCFDHEEVGSESAHGAGGPFLNQTLARLVGNEPQAFERAIARSFCVSADMAHAVHPNYPELHEPEHMPKLGEGPVIKRNNNQRYATSGDSGARFAEWCAEAGVKPQRFVTRNDLACGSTIGPITAANLGITTVDVGNPMLSMHSIREMAAVKDVAAMIKVLGRFYR